MILIATDSGVRVFRESGGESVELSGHSVGAMALGSASSVVAVVDGNEVWRRANDGVWSKVAVAAIGLQSIVMSGEAIFAGGMEEAAMLRMGPDSSVERLASFDHVQGREEWFAGGPPLGVRSLAATLEGTLLAGVHVGGIPRSDDFGETWQPTLPVIFDVHEVRAHASRLRLAAAATAVGLCISNDAGVSWFVHKEGLPIANSLAVAWLESEALFSIQEGPFATQSQLWRWTMDTGRMEQVRDGLPAWFEGKIDTGWIVSGAGRAAVVDRGGNLWLSSHGSTGWQRLGSVPGYISSLMII